MGEAGEKTLEPRLVEVLICLAARSGTVVSRDDLLDVAWEGAFVSENTLSQAISRLRRALEDDRHQPRYLETIPKSGYRLLVPVEALDEPRNEATASVLQGPATQPKKSAWPWAWGLALIAVISSAWAWQTFRPGAGTALRVVDLKPESTLVGSQFDPRLSPDGERLAFAWSASEQGLPDIWVQEVGGDEPMRLTDDPGLERLPTWSPDGTSIAFVRASASGEDCGIFRTPSIGGRSDRIADCFPSMRYLDWSPEGTHLVASAGREPGLLALELIDIASGRSRQLTDPTGDGAQDRWPHFSPDGQQIAFSRVVGRARHDVMTIPTSGGSPRTLTQDSWGQVRGVAWAPDGKSIFYSSNRDGRYSLWRIPVAGGEIVKVPIHDEWVTEPTLVGSRLIYRTYRDQVDLWELSLGAGPAAPGPPEQRLASTRSERQASWSPDGTKIAFLSDRSGTLEVWTGSAAGDGLLRHTDFRGPPPTAPAWSPDGGRLVFDAAVEGHSDLWSVAADSRRPARLTHEPSEDRNPTFSADGSRLYFTSDRSGAWEIWQMPATGGPAHQVTQGGGFFARESPEGDALYFARLEDPGIWRLSLDGGSPEPPQLVLPDLDLADWGSWVVNEQGFYFVSRRPATISFLGFGDQEPTSLYSIPRTLPYLEPSLSLSPGARSLLFSMVTSSDDELIRAELAGP